MNNPRCLGVALVCLLPLVACLTAQQSEERQRRSPEGFLPPGIIEKLGLSEAQKEKVAKMNKEFQEKLEAAKKQYAEALEKAKQNQDREQARSAGEALQKNIATFQEQLQNQLRQVLTAEQVERLAQLRREQPDKAGLGNLPRILGQLDLTEEQRDKIGRFMKEVREKQEIAQKKIQEAIDQARQNQDRQKVRELTEVLEKQIGKLHEELHSQVKELLNESQKKAFAEAVQQPQRAVQPFGVGQVIPPPLQERLGLTPEQKTKITNLQKEVDAKLREILTEEQNKMFERFKGGASLERRKPKDQ